MNTTSEQFLAQLSSFPPDYFEHRLGQRMSQLGLGAMLERNDLTLLCEAGMRAHICASALNAGPPEKINPEHETRRVRLEWEFMTARDIFFACPGWQTLDESIQGVILQMFLNVTVAQECLAW